MAYTLGDAAKATGKSKETIASAIRSGRISAVRDGTGTFRIDPAELHRIYPRTVYSDTMEAAPTPANTVEKIISAGSIKDGGGAETVSALQAHLSEKEAIIAELREERDRWRQQATALLASYPPQKGVFARLFRG